MDLVERRGAVGRRHPWEVARARFFLSLLESHGALDQASQWLDVGAGDGWLGSELRARLPERSPSSSSSSPSCSKVVCWDINYTADDLGGPRPGPGVELTDRRPDQRFDGALLLDVIEHVPDDEDFLGQVVELMSPGGWVLVSVPAHPLLFSTHDTALRHHRRYVPSQCARLIDRAGIDILVAGGVFHALMAVRGLQVARERLAPPEPSSTGVGQWEHGRTLTGALTSVLTAETRASAALARRGWGAPGLSWWALGTRRR
ncbi:MAG TPA: methyltransferase domain-containing protein [Acidimicrobiales bacterium]|nr:methyltransferase domain-containing protein [Acidimicrobiales bacterium]